MPGDRALSPAQPPRGSEETVADDLPGLRWIVPDAATAPHLRLRVGLDAGGGEPRLNAAGDVLVHGVRDLGSGLDEAYLPVLTRRDAAGAGLWSRAYSASARCFAALAADGSTLAAGGFSGRLDLGEAQLESFRNPTAVAGSASSRDATYGRGQPSRDLAVFRLAADGTVAWARRFGDAGNQEARAVELTPAGDLVVVGQFEGELVMDGERVLSSGGGGPPADVFIARLDLAGDVLTLWRQEPLYVDGITVNADGSLWLAGRDPVELRANRLWRLGPDGKRELSLEVNSVGVSHASRTAPGPDGSLYVAYDDLHDSPLLLGQRIAARSALVRVSAGGNVEWLRPLVTDFALTTLAADPAGNVLVAGAFRGSIDSGGGPLQGNGPLDVFVSSHAPDGKVRYSFALGGSGLDSVNGVAASGMGRWLIPFYLEQPVTLGDQPVGPGEHLLWVDEL
jgi:hypothetical protein